MVENEHIYTKLWDTLHNSDVEQLMTLLRESYVNIDHRYVAHDLQTFLMRVCYVDLETSHLLNILEAIFDLKPDVNIQDSWGRTVLMHGCIANKPVLIEGLLDYQNTDVSLLDFDGNSALTYAVNHCDRFTVEDLLQHPAGPKLLSVHNSKGQSPLTIAQQKGDKSVIRLIESYLNNTVALDKKKKRKPRNRDVINLPPTYSSSPDRTYNNPSASKIVQSTQNTQCNIYQNSSPRNEIKLNIIATKRELNFEPVIKDKCESAPVIRTPRDVITSTLSLSSPKLIRRHHKQDCLLQETLLSNHSRNFPQMSSRSAKQNGGDHELELPEYSLRRQRRPSLSLPDLHSAKGFLVNSGSSTPSTENDRNSPSRDKPEDDDKDDSNYVDDDDDVFSRSCPISSEEIGQKQKSYFRQNSEKHVVLPEVPKGKTCLMSPAVKRKGLLHSRLRKYSNSDDQLHRSAYGEQ